MAAVYLRNKLAEQLAVAESSMVDAAGSAPMYGTLAVLRSVYEELERENYSEDWVRLSQDLVGMSYNVWRVVAPVVASDSPEGHLPMDQSKDGTQVLQRIMKNSIGGQGNEERDNMVKNT